jgi:16S rRNA C1402 (ribose-2'-O) methylase RsmI
MRSQQRLFAGNRPTKQRRKALQALAEKRERAILIESTNGEDNAG